MIDAIEDNNDFGDINDMGAGIEQENNNVK